MKPLRIVVLISGNGSNLQAIIDAKQKGDLNIEIEAVISNCAGVYGLARAEKAHIPTQVIRHQDYTSRDQFDHALMATIDPYDPELIVLAGFMRRLGPEVARKYAGKMINIHPSLLPNYPGLHTHARILQDKQAFHGTSIHFVTEDLDAGPIISQAIFPVSPQSTEESLKDQVQALEHILYPMTLKWFAERRIRLKGNQILIDEQPLPSPVVLGTKIDNP